MFSKLKILLTVFSFIKSAYIKVKEWNENKKFIKNRPFLNTKVYYMCPVCKLTAENTKHYLDVEYFCPDCDVPFYMSSKPFSDNQKGIK